MGIESGFGRPKTKEELENQLKKVEDKIGKPLVAEDAREEALTLSTDELAARFPEEYPLYFKNLTGRSLQTKESSAEVSYTSEELGLARSGLAGVAKVSKELLEKIESDANIKAYSPLVLFPEISERVYDKKEKPEITRLPAQTRGRAFKCVFKDETFVIKQVENNNESNIAAIASELGIGPHQYESVQGYVTETWIEGSPIAKLKEEEATAELMEDLGKKIGAALKKLHERNIIFNDQLIRDDFSRSHVIVTPEKEVRFIDFGAAVDLSNFPELSDEDLYTLARTESSFEVQMALKDIQFEQDPTIQQKRTAEFLAKYRQQLSQFANAQELIKAKDTQLLNEGIYFLGHVLPNTTSFARGIQSTLYEQGA